MPRRQLEAWVWGLVGINLGVLSLRIVAEVIIVDMFASGIVDGYIE